MCSAHRRRYPIDSIGIATIPVAGIYRRLAATSLSPPRGAEQESDADGKRKSRVGPFLERFVDGIDHIVADLAHRVHRLLPFAGGIRHRPLDVRSRARPSSIALGGDDVGDLLGEPPDVVA